MNRKSVCPWYVDGAFGTVQVVVKLETGDEPVLYQLAFAIHPLFSAAGEESVGEGRTVVLSCFAT